ncbi:PP2C family protein-serine/threonine phosphatase [Poriferisphaera sp. WC338]|uniref:PP2C family protein-serine/threonine phosphatase n=1 Tax=Poriferisphaera sp. WC338 TaxID=3425129 RepID=UPI003D817446
MMQETVTEEFQPELDQRWQSWLVRRFIRYCIFSGIVAILGGFLYIWAESAFVSSVHLWLNVLTFGISNVPVLIVLFLGIMAVRTGEKSREQVLNVIIWTIAIMGFFAIVVSTLLESYLSMINGRGITILESIRPGLIILVTFTLHLFACIFIPFPQKDAIKSITPLWVMSIPMILISKLYPFWIDLLFALGAILSGVPGLLICYIRAQRYSNQFYLQRLSGSYSDLKRELSAARQIHEMLFPGQKTDGDIQIRYHYEPMKQLGGDFLYIKEHRGDNGQLTAISNVVVDVTGHGITAALAVNRLHGEIERLFAEFPEASPEQIIRALNKYIYLTISRESVYATAFAAKAFIQNEQIEWVNAGHPQPYLLHPDHEPVSLFTSAIMLGAVNDDLYHLESNTSSFIPNSRLLIYTDGIIEARNGDGEMLNNPGLEAMLAECDLNVNDDGLLTTLSSRLKDFRSGAADDDVLLVEMKRGEPS